MFTVKTAKGREIARCSSFGKAKRLAYRRAIRRGCTMVVTDDVGTVLFQV